MMITDLATATLMSVDMLHKVSNIYNLNSPWHIHVTKAPMLPNMYNSAKHCEWITVMII